MNGCSLAMRPRRSSSHLADFFHTLLYFLSSFFRSLNAILFVPLPLLVLFALEREPNNFVPSSLLLFLLSSLLRFLLQLTITFFSPARPQNQSVLFAINDKVFTAAVWNWPETNTTWKDAGSLMSMYWDGGEQSFLHLLL